MASNLVASFLLVAIPFVPSSFLLLVVRPGAPTSVLDPRSDGLQPNCEAFSRLWNRLAYLMRSCEFEAGQASSVQIDVSRQTQFLF